jgi:hypothetical protein
MINNNILECNTLSVKKRNFLFLNKTIEPSHQCFWVNFCSKIQYCFRTFLFSMKNKFVFHCICHFTLDIIKYFIFIVFFNLLYFLIL